MVRNSPVCCAYLYIISRYGYPPPVSDTVRHIGEMAAAGFTRLELEGIGGDNIRYLYRHRTEIAGALHDHGCEVPVLCLVLPKLGSVSADDRARALELFETGCKTARYLGADGVLDNGPLLPLEYPADFPIMRHYKGSELASLLPPEQFDWDHYWAGLTATFAQACRIAAGYGLDFHLHPCEGSLTAGTDAFLLFADAVKEPNLRFNFDTANQFLIGDSLSISLLRLRDRVSYIHISDNRGTHVEHLPPGDGAIHWDGFFSVLAKTGFRGKLAIDVGGHETGIADIEEAYRRSARWLEKQMAFYLPALALA